MEQGCGFMCVGWGQREGAEEWCLQPFHGKRAPCGTPRNRPARPAPARSVFASAVAGGGCVKAIRVPDGKRVSNSRVKPKVQRAKDNWVCSIGICLSSWLLTGAWRTSAAPT